MSSPCNCAAVDNASISATPGFSRRAARNPMRRKTHLWLNMWSTAPHQHHSSRITSKTRVQFKSSQQLVVSNMLMFVSLGCIGGCWLLHVYTFSDGFHLETTGETALENYLRSSATGPLLIGFGEGVILSGLLFIGDNYDPSKQVGGDDRGF